MSKPQIADRGPPRDSIQEFATLIVEKLELGVKPWVRPWDPMKCAGPDAPMNAVTGEYYHGVNNLRFSMHPLAFESGDPRFCTYNQAQSKDWQVKRGEHGTVGWFYKQLEVDDDKADAGKRFIPLLKSFVVFHVSQIDGPPPYKPPTVEECPWKSEEATEIIMKSSGVPVRIGGDRAFYSPPTDHIQMPPSVAFKSAAHEACVKIHELAHSTGKETRLNRDLTGRFGSAAYAMEELFAELASAFVGVTLNIPTDIPNHASYIDHWLKPLKSDKKLIFHAAATAQKITDWILNLHPDYAEFSARHEQPERPGPSHGSQRDKSLTA